MAEELGSKLGFDVGQAVTALNQLKRQLDSYSASLAASAGDASKFNAEQAKVDKLLVAGAAAAEKAAKGMKEFASTSSAGGRGVDDLSNKLDRLIGQFNRLSVARTKDAALASRGGTSGVGPLSGQLSQRADKIAQDANTLQNLQLKAGSDAIKERIQLTQNLTNAEKQRNNLVRKNSEAAVFKAFGRSPTNGIAQDSKKDADEFNKNTQSMGISWTGLVKIFATQIAFSALGTVISQFKEGIAAAKDFEIQLAQIQTISSEFTAAGLDATGEAVKRLSDQFGQPIEDVAAGLYEALSNQIGDAADATLFLNDALTFSKASVTSAADSVDLLSGVINSYGLTAASTSAISDQLFVTIDRGRVKGEELANTFGRILPLAKTLGIDLAEVNTALAELTIQGVKPSDALTQLTNVMLKLLKPTESLKAVFDELGVANAEAGIAIFGFDGFLRKVTESTKGAATEVAELFNQVRGTRGVIGIITRDQQKYAATLSEIEKAAAGAGQAQAAANKIQSTNAAQLQREITQLRNFLVNDFGRSAISVILAITDKVGGLKTAFLAFASVVGVVGGILASAGLVILFGQAANAVQLLAKSINAAQIATEAATISAAKYIAVWGGAAAIAAALGVITVGLASQTDQANALSKAFRKNQEEAEQSIKAQIKAESDGLEARKKNVKESISAIVEDFRQRQLLYNRDKAAAFSAQKDITRQFEDELSRRKSLISRALSELEGVQKKSAERIASINKKRTDTEFQQNANRFERDIKDADGEGLITALLARSNKVQEAARKAQREGNTEFSEQLQQEALDLANRVADATGGRARGEAQINKLLNDQRILNQDLIAQEEQKAKQAAAAELSTRKELLKLSSAIDEIGSIDQKINKDQPTGKALEELLSQRQALADGITQGLINLKPGDLSALNDIRQIFTDLQKPIIDPTTGGLSNISQAAQNASKDLISTLQTQADRTPLEIKIRFKALTGEELGTEGFGAGQTQAALLGTQLETNIENEKQLTVFQGRIDNANKNIRASFDALTTTLNQTARQAGNFDILSNITGGEGSVKRVAQFEAQANKIRNGLLEIVNTAQRAAQSGDIALLEEQLRKLDEVGAAAKAGDTGLGGTLQKTIGGLFGGTSGGTNLNTSLEALRTNLTELAKAQSGLTQGTQQSGLSQALENAITTNNTNALAFLQTINAERQAANNLTSQITEVGVASGTAVQNANAAFAQFSTDSAQREIDDLIRKFADLKSAAAQAPGAPTGTTQGNARGGLVHYFANGGFVPRGTDTVPAMLSPGEIVMNAKASRSFYTELMAMNAGVKPIYRAEGGPVSNVTNVGDIHMTIQSTGSGRVSGRSLARDFRRELRRGTIRRF